MLCYAKGNTHDGPQSEGFRNTYFFAAFRSRKRRDDWVYDSNHMSRRIVPSNDHELRRWLYELRRHDPAELESILFREENEMIEAEKREQFEQEQALDFASE